MSLTDDHKDENQDNNKKTAKFRLFKRNQIFAKKILWKDKQKKANSSYELAAIKSQKIPMIKLW